MKVINIKVIPNSKKSLVQREGDIFKVRVQVPPVEGKANKAAVEVLADFFNVKRRNVRIIRGEKSREKVVEIDM